MSEVNDRAEERDLDADESLCRLASKMGANMAMADRLSKTLLWYIAKVRSLRAEKDTNTEAAMKSSGYDYNEVIGLGMLMLSLQKDASVDRYEVQKVKSGGYRARLVSDCQNKEYVGHGSGTVGAMVNAIDCRWEMQPTTRDVK